MFAGIVKVVSRTTTLDKHPAQRDSSGAMASAVGLVAIRNRYDVAVATDDHEKSGVDVEVTSLSAGSCKTGALSAVDALIVKLETGDQLPYCSGLRALTRQ